MNDAITIKEISGERIETIPVGTKFEIVCECPNYFYATCRGLGVSSVWLDEFRYLKEDENV